MTTADDLRDLRDALDSIAHGALPRWGKPTTKTGEEAVHAAKAMYDRYVRALLAESGGRAAMAEMARHEDNHRTHAEILTDYSEKLEQERDAARRDFIRVADALGLVSTDDTGRIGAVAGVEEVVEEARQAARALARQPELFESMSMSCEEPPTGCECAGCMYAREKGGALNERPR